RRIFQFSIFGFWAFQEVLVLPGVRIVASVARLLRSGGMGLNRGHVFFLMTFEADLAPAFSQQPRLVCLMRIVASAAFAIGDRVMFVSGRSDLLLEFVMALVTQAANRLGEQLLELRLVRFVAGNAFTVLDRLMLHLGRMELFIQHIMALEAEL